MKPRSKRATLIAGCLFILGLTACDKPEEARLDKGPAEAAGEKIDRAAEVAGKKLNEAAATLGRELEQAKDQAMKNSRGLREEAGKKMERVGENIQEAAENAK